MSVNRPKTEMQTTLKTLLISRAHLRQQSVGNTQYSASVIVAHLQRFATYEADANVYVLNPQQTILNEQNPL
jgi:hypothetical protein